MRTFHLLRVEDETGVSGVGLVAEGVEWTGGRIVLHWLGTHTSQVHYDCIAEVIEIHGHGGKTQVIWDDEVKKIRNRKKKTITIVEK